MFYFDLASPIAYLAAERVLHTIEPPCPWQPILARRLPAAERFDAFRCAEEAAAFRADVERRAGALGLLPIVWPEPFPFDSSLAMRVATYAGRIGKLVAFTQAAFRQAFAAGHPLDDEQWVLIAAAACEMHPRAVLRGAATAAIAAELERATRDAQAAGVHDVPAVRVGGRVFVGERSLEEAGAA